MALTSVSEKLVCKHTSVTDTWPAEVGACSGGTGSAGDTVVVVIGLNWHGVVDAVIVVVIGGLNWHGVVDGGPSGIAVGM